MHAASISNSTKANEYSQRSKVAKSYNLMRLLVGGSCKMNEDVPSGTDGLKYYSGASATRNDNDTVRKSYDLMRMITGGGR